MRLKNNSAFFQLWSSDSETVPQSHYERAECHGNHRTVSWGSHKTLLLTLMVLWRSSGACTVHIVHCRAHTPSTLTLTVTKKEFPISHNGGFWTVGETRVTQTHANSTWFNWDSNWGHYCSGMTALFTNPSSLSLFSVIILHGYKHSTLYSISLCNFCLLLELPLAVWQMHAIPP